jgi:hypothetical protein
MINEIEAKQIAAKFVRESVGRELPLCDVRFQCDPAARVRQLGIVIDEQDELFRPCWTVTFQTVLEDGNLLDSSTIVNVDAETGQPAYFEEVWSRAKNRHDAT